MQKHCSEAVCSRRCMPISVVPASVLKCYQVSNNLNLSVVILIKLMITGNGTSFLRQLIIKHYELLFYT